MSIGVEHKGEVVAGVVYDPCRDELFTAEKGSGAFLNGKRLKVSASARLIESLLVTGFPYDIAANPDAAVERFVGFLMAAQPWIFPMWRREDSTDSGKSISTRGTWRPGHCSCGRQGG